MRLTTTLIAGSLLALPLVFPLAFLGGPAAAWPPPKAKKAGKVNEAQKKLEDEVKDLQGQVDRELLRLFQDQVQAGSFRSRLSILQREWQKLFAQQGPKPVAKKYPAPAPLEFAVDEAVTSDAEGLEQALLTGNCKKRVGCRIWARISFGKDLVKKGDKFELSAEVKSKTGMTKLAVPAKEMTVTGPVMTVDLALDAIYIYKGSYEGTLKVLCGERFKRKTFTFELLETY